MSKIKLYKTNDYDVRAALVRRLLHDGVPRSDIRHELPLDSFSGAGRADVVVLCDTALYGYEIKSGRDVLERCAGQYGNYCDALDRCHFVIDKRHLQTVEKDQSIVRSRCTYYCHDKAGFYDAGHCRINERIVDGRPSWDLGRHLDISKPMRHSVDMDRYMRSSSTAPHAMACLLWRDEAMMVARGLGLKPKTRTDAVAYFAEHLSLSKLRPMVIEKLRARVLSAWEVNFWKRFDSEENQQQSMKEGQE